MESYVWDTQNGKMKIYFRDRGSRNQQQVSSFNITFTTKYRSTLICQIAKLHGRSIHIRKSAFRGISRKDIENVHDELCTAGTKHELGFLLSTEETIYERNSETSNKCHKGNVYRGCMSMNKSKIRKEEMDLN